MCSKRVFSRNNLDINYKDYNTIKSGNEILKAVKYNDNNAILNNSIISIEKNEIVNTIKNIILILLPLTIIIFFFSIPKKIISQNKELSSEFHKQRRAELRKKLPNNSVAVLFSSPIRNRANDVDYEYHPDPNFYYLTGWNEPHSVLLIYSNPQKLSKWHLKPNFFLLIFVYSCLLKIVVLEVIVSFFKISFLQPDSKYYEEFS